MKNHNREAFLNELEQKEWDTIYYSQDPNEMWHIWKNMLMKVLTSIQKNQKQEITLDHKRIKTPNVS